MTAPEHATEPGQDFVALFLTHQARIYAFIVSILPNRADAEDILQEAGITMYRRFSTFEPGSNFFAWACRIAYHKVLDLRKREARHPLLFESEFLELIANEHIARGDSIQTQLRALEGCLAKLREKDRALLERHYGSRSTIKALAQSLLRPADTLYKSLRRIRTTLHACVTRAIAVEESP